MGALHRSWDRLYDSSLVSWSDDCLQDLWWMDPDRLLRGVSLSQLSPDFDLWSEASDVSWGAHLGLEVVSGLWSREEPSLSIDAREWLAVERGLLHYRSSASHSTVTVFAGNSTTVAFLCNAGTLDLQPSLSLPSIIAYLPMVSTPPCSPGSPVHHGKSQCSGRLSLSPGPDPRVRVDSSHRSLSEAPQSMAAHGRPVWYLRKLSLLHFSPFRVPQAMGTDALLQSWDHLQAYAFPPWARISQVCHKLRLSFGAVLTDSPILASETLVSRSAGPSDHPIGSVASSTRPAQSSLSPQASSSCDLPGLRDSPPK